MPGTKTAVKAEEAQHFIVIQGLEGNQVISLGQGCTYFSVESDIFNFTTEARGDGDTAMVVSGMFIPKIDSQTDKNLICPKTWAHHRKNSRVIHQIENEIRKSITARPQNGNYETDMTIGGVQVKVIYEIQPL